MYGLRLITPAADPALDMTAVKQHLRLADDSDDAYLRDILIPAAAAEAEAATHRQLITATWELTLDRFPHYGQPIELPLGELQSVSSIKYTGAAGAEQTWAAADYRVDEMKEPALVWPAYGEIYPITRYEDAAVRVRYTCGYGAKHTNVPALLREAMLLVVGHLYVNREAVVTGTIASELPLSARHIFERYALGDDFTRYQVDRSYYEQCESASCGRW